MDVRKLFNTCSEVCNNCPILKKPLSRHTVLDEDIEPVDILFVSDFPKPHQGDFVPFRPQEFTLIANKMRDFGSRVYGFKVGYTSALKCPIGKSDEAGVKEIKICSSHLFESIGKYKPKLVFSCGKMPTTMFFGKNRADKDVRGRAHKMTISGHEFYMVPIIHPWQVISEPVNSYLFNVDVENNINEFILGVKKTTDFKFTIVDSFEILNEVKDRFLAPNQEISVDIECTGLNFLSDKINTIALTRLENGDPAETICFPIDHKAANVNLKLKAALIDLVAKILRDPSIRKILQNSQFDLKFLILYGADGAVNIWDTKLIQHLYNEDVPKSLQDLVYYYYPNEVIG